MTRKSFLTITSAIATSLGLFIVMAPAVFLEQLKHVPASATAVVMLRTVGALLVATGVLNFMVRAHEPSPTLRAILAYNLVLQLALIPIDPLAYATGTYNSLAAFVPNTILHIVLALGFAYHLTAMRDLVRSP